jgi:hypothetical protein
LVARTEKLLQEVKQECMDLGLGEDKILLCQGDVTNTSDLLKIRQSIEEGKLTKSLVKHAHGQHGQESIQSIS